MAQRQFRSDDTSKWGDGFGNGSDGALTISSNVTDSSANDTITGTSGSTSATFGTGTGFANGNLVLIHQTQGTGATNWELNKILSGGGTTSVTLAYPLINTYTSGAQVYLLKQYTSVTINPSQTLTGQAWNGSKGGILAILANTSIVNNGTINVVQNGFGGGANASINGQAGQGEGTAGHSSASTSANGNGSGGTNTFGSGDGGSNRTQGTQAGDGSGNLGSVVGSADGTTMSLGAGGSGCAGNNNQSPPGPGTSSTNGGGIVILISPSISGSGLITLDSAASSGYLRDTSNRTVTAGPGAGGFCLIKGQTVNLSSMTAHALGGAVNSPPNFGGTTDSSGAGGNGGFHVDYGISFSGTTNPTVDTRQDYSLSPQNVFMGDI